MRHRLSLFTPSPAMAVAVVVLLAACGGLALAATPSSPVIKACANKRSGALRIARKCRRGERFVSWNVQGTQGNRGSTGPKGFKGATGTTGATGATGPRGLQGEQGPGASGFATTLAQGTTGATLATVGNGLIVKGTCTGATAQLVIEATAGGADNIELSGTTTNEEIPAGLKPFDAKKSGPESVSSTTLVDLDAIGRDSTVNGRFARLDLHGAFGTPSCEFWGMITPSS